MSKNIAVFSDGTGQDGGVRESARDQRPPARPHHTARPRLRDGKRRRLAGEGVAHREELAHAPGAALALREVRRRT